MLFDENAPASTLTGASLGLVHWIYIINLSLSELCYTILYFYVNNTYY